MYAVKLVLNIISLALNAAIFVLIALPIIDRSGFLRVDWRPELTFAAELALAPAIKSQVSAPPAQFNRRISLPIAQLDTPQLGQYQTVSSYTSEASSLRRLLDKAQQPAQRWVSVEDQTDTAFVQAERHKPPCPTSNFAPWSDCFGRFELPWGAIYLGVWQQDQFNGIGKLLLENGANFLCLLRISELYKKEFISDSKIWLWELLKGFLERRGLSNFHSTNPSPINEVINTPYLTDSYIIFTLIEESVCKIKIFDQKMMVKSGLENFFLKFLHAEAIFF